jgi:hypothetical protein
VDGVTRGLGGYLNHLDRSLGGGLWTCDRRLKDDVCVRRELHESSIVISISFSPFYLCVV